MSNRINIHPPHRRKKLLFYGILAFFSGIALAYFTGDVEPWGSIGGIMSVVGLASCAISGVSKQQEFV